jgi:hypothetical protein
MGAELEALECLVQVRAHGMFFRPQLSRDGGPHLLDAC